MLLTDYFRSEKDATWDIARQCGVKYGVIRLPETGDFDYTDPRHWETVYKHFTDYGIIPKLLEPMPNELHDHIKTGDAHRDASIEKVLSMFPIMQRLGIDTICFNFMAYVGWTRTSYHLPERGGAYVTGFDPKDYHPTADAISEEELWEHYTYFIKAILPEAERYGIKLALHPDDPPVSRLGNVSRIMTSAKNMKKAIYDICPSDMLGITMCQATFYIMGENLDQVIRDFADKIFFIHFRNTAGTLAGYRETFHDNGSLNMRHLINLYEELGIDVPIRVDHVPTLKGEHTETEGYAALARLFAIGYLKGLLEKG